MDLILNVSFFVTCVNGSCSELAPHSHTLCSTTLIANFWWATHCGVLQSSISSEDKCEWTLCNNSSKHSAASPKQPNGKRLHCSSPLASARLNGSGHNAGSELVCNCWNNSWIGKKTDKQNRISNSNFISFRKKIRRQISFQAYSNDLS